MASSGASVTPPASPPSPSASFYDVSDDEEGDYNTIAHASSGRGVKLLFSKSKVYVHPTQSSKDNIPGFIAIVQQKPAPQQISSAISPGDASNYLLAWVPESSLGDAYNTYVKVDLSEGNSPPRQTYLVPALPTSTARHDPIGLYAFSVPLKEIYSILVRPPSLGWWFGSLVVNTRAGDSLPALFFHDSECQSTILQQKKKAKEDFDPFDDAGGMFWGGDEVLRWLPRYVNVERSGADPSAYLIDPSEEDRKSFGQILTTARSADKSQNKSGQSGGGGGGGSGSGGGGRDAGMDPLTRTLKETRWKVLEQFSKITTFTRRTANDIAGNPKVPPKVRRLMRNPEIQTLQDEFDSARLYLARWAMSIAEQSERERNQRIWTAKDVLEMENSEVGDFEILDMEAGNMSLSDRRRPVTMKEWKDWFNPRTGRLQITTDEVKERIFHGGLDPNDGVREEAWLFLLGVYSWDSSEEERRIALNSKREEFVRLKGRWWDRMLEETSTEESEWWKDQKARIEKDVHRTDRNIPLFAGEDIPHPDPDSPFAEIGTNVHMEQLKDMLLTYNEYNRDLGYVQGMSDLLAPIYAVMQDDAVAFWGFVGFMDRMERNYLRDQSGMRAQLLTLDQLVQLMDPQLYLHLQSADSTNFFFFFRMLLVWYKREFEWVDVLRLWETLWTDYLSSNFHLFIALAILEKHRDVIMTHLKQFDEVLKYINELSTTIDLVPILAKAEALFRRFQRTVEAIDKKEHFPPPKSPSDRPKPQKKPQNPPLQPMFGPITPPAPAHSNTAGHRRSSSATAAAPAPAPAPEQSSSTSTQRAPERSRAGSSAGETASSKREAVISPELRQLLSREIIVMDGKQIREHGGGTS